MKRVEIESFREAIDLGSRCATPTTTDDAQYSLPYAVAAALVFDGVGAREVGEAKVRDPDVARLLGVIGLREEPEFSKRFPAERIARVRVTLVDDRVLVSAPTQARGGPDNALSDAELRDKYFALAEPALGEARAARIETLVQALPDDAALSPLLDALLAPP